MSLFYRLQGSKVIFFGPGTFHKKETLKSHGARFNSADKSWVVESSEEVLALAIDLGAVGPVGGNSGDSARPQTKQAPSQDPSPSRGIPQTVISISVNDGTSGLTVSQLLAEAGQAVSRSFPNPVWVVGEIQNMSRRGENFFFEIAEAKQGSHATATITVKANLWGTNYKYLERRHGPAKLAELFVDGTRVRFFVRVGLYKDRGQISLTVEDVDPAFTQGALALARAELLKKLRAEGIDQKNKALPLPAFPFRVAFISAPASRAQTDFEHQLTDGKQFPGTIFFIPCPMQGERVPKAVVKSLEIATASEVDLIVISRGGGSAADLRWFDGEEIARAIAQCPIPVIAAIGHHDDRSVAEEVCHTRQKTPTAAAEFILEIFRSTRTQLNEHAHWLATSLDREMTRFTKSLSAYEVRLSEACQTLFQRLRERLNYLVVSLERAFDALSERQMRGFSAFSMALSQGVWRQIEQLQEQLHRSSGNLNRSVQDFLNQSKDHLATLEQALVRKDPTPWLESGWTQLSQAGRTLMSIQDIRRDIPMNARLKDGQLTLKIEDIKPTKLKNEREDKRRKEE